MKLKSVLLVPILLTLLLTSPQKAAAATGEPCIPSANSGSFLGFKPWYRYLNGVQSSEIVQVKDSSGNVVSTHNKCEIKFAEDGDQSIKGSLNSIWLIGLAVLEILLQIAGLVAVAIVAFGGFKYITSQGQPDATKAARQTIVNAFIGIVITIIAAAAINFGAELLQRP